MSTVQHETRAGRGSRRRWAAFATAVAVGAGSLIAAQPAAAEEDPWVAEVVQDNGVEDVYRFTVPNSAIQPATGITGTVVAVEGNFAPGKTWTTLNMGASGGNWSTTLGPLEPGLYYYQYSARPAWNQDAIPFRNPASPQEVTSKPTWNTLFVDGPGAEWLADAPAGGSLDAAHLRQLRHRAPSARRWSGRLRAMTRTVPSRTRCSTSCRTRVRAIANGWSSGDCSRSSTISRSREKPSRWSSSWVTARSMRSADEVVKNLLPAAEGAFNVSSDAEDRAIAGIGRGAEQALSLLVSATGEFSNVGSFSGDLEQNVGQGQGKADQRRDRPHPSVRRQRHRPELQRDGGPRRQAQRRRRRVPVGRLRPRDRRHVGHLAEEPARLRAARVPGSRRHRTQ